MARQFLKAVIENTIMEEKSELELSESYEELETEGGTGSNREFV